MKSCIHEGVCKYSIENDDKECVLIDMCKFKPEPTIEKKQKTAKAKKTTPKKRKYKKREERSLPLETKKKGRGRSQGKYLHLTTSDKDIARAKNILIIRRKRGKLSENQMAALDMYKGVRKLAEHQRQQILNILNDLEK